MAKAGNNAYSSVIIRQPGMNNHVAGFTQFFFKEKKREIQGCLSIQSLIKVVFFVKIQIKKH